MKYIDAEKLIAEIERQADILVEIHGESLDRKDDNAATYYFGKIVASEDILFLIDSILEEKSSEDLEKAAEDSWTDYEYSDSFNLYSRCYKDGFRAGAEWREEHQKMMPFRVVPEDAWETSEGMAFAPRFKVVDNDGCENIPVHGISEELTLYYKED